MPQMEICKQSVNEKNPDLDFILFNRNMFVLRACYMLPVNRTAPRINIGNADMDLFNLTGYPDCHI